jgi:branched-chain amino acid transport system ATP-binding protein
MGDYSRIPGSVVNDEESWFREQNFGYSKVCVPSGAAIRCCHQVLPLILDMGKIVIDGTAQEVLENEDLRHEYLAI